VGVPRSTVRGWLDRYAGVAQSAEAIGLKPIQCGFDSLHQHQAPAYAYLLGIYLGDGYIGKMPRTYRLRIFLNRKQADVIARVEAVIAAVLPGARVGRTQRRHAAVTEVTCYSSDWPLLFPQHGPGRKHRRPIVLEPGQAAIVSRHPAPFLQGLLESDGGRHRRIVRGRDYPAYSFTNRSEDILRLFAWACDLMQIRWRRSSSRVISIAAVAMSPEWTHS
jgi:hypothetical protein